MAGSNGNNQKNNQFGKTSVFSNETINDHSLSRADTKIKFQGVFNIGQTIEFSKKEQSQPNNEKPWNNYFVQQEKVISNNHEFEVKKAIEELRNELKNLILTTKEISHEIDAITVQEQVEFNQYQLNFLNRIKVFIINFRQNISEASTWLNSSANKNKKKNAFWNKAKDKKTGGEQYMFSNEHSASRSVN